MLHSYRELTRRSQGNYLLLGKAMGWQLLSTFNCITLLLLLLLRLLLLGGVAYDA